MSACYCGTMLDDRLCDHCEVVKLRTRVTELAWKQVGLTEERDQLKKEQRDVICWEECANVSATGYSDPHCTLDSLILTPFWTGEERVMKCSFYTPERGKPTPEGDMK